MLYFHRKYPARASTTPPISRPTIFTLWVAVVKRMNQAEAMAATPMVIDSAAAALCIMFLLSIVLRSRMIGAALGYSSFGEREGIDSGDRSSHHDAASIA